VFQKLPNRKSYIQTCISDISIEKERNPITKKWLNNVYTLLDKEEWDSHENILPMAIHGKIKSKPWVTDAQTHGNVVPNKETNLNNTNSKETNIATQVLRKDQEVFDLIELFKIVNPSYRRFFGNKTQRLCLKRLIDLMGSEKLERVIKTLPRTNGLEFAPVITTPYELEKKLGIIFSLISNPCFTF